MIKKILKEIRLKINKIGSNFRRNKLKIKNPTIISNNCWAGIVSQYLGIKYYTPTIGLYFFAEEYIKFLERFDYYIEQKLKIIDTKDSKYYKNMLKKKEEKLKDFIGKGFEIKTDYKDDVFTITYSFDYTKLDMQKFKEVVPNLNLRDDNTLGYSQFKEALINGGYKEK